MHQQGTLLLGNDNSFIYFHIYYSTSNSKYRHLQQFWGASGDFWESAWARICDLLGNNEFHIAVTGTVIFSFTVFALANTFFISVDLLGWPKFAKKYKIQPDEEVKIADFWKAARVALFNLFVVGYPAMMFYYYLFKWRGNSFGPELPTFHYVLGELIIFTIVEEFGFYYSHRLVYFFVVFDILRFFRKLYRLVHTPLLYKRIHKKHHEWTAPIGIVSIYAHPVEHFVSNLTPVFLGPFITGAHLATFWLWIAMALVNTTISHSGYHLPFLPSAEAHDFHHLKFVNCFGVLGILDRLHGTDNIFRKSKQYQRHFLFFSLTPPREMVPDEPKCKKSE